MAGSSDFTRQKSMKHYQEDNVANQYQIERTPGILLKHYKVNFNFRKKINNFNSLEL